MGRFAKASLEMNVRAARRVAREIEAVRPILSAAHWPIAQGLAYVRVKGPTTAGWVEIVLRTQAEADRFLAFCRDWEKRKNRPI